VLDLDATTELPATLWLDVGGEPLVVVRVGDLRVPGVVPVVRAFTLSSPAGAFRETPVPALEADARFGQLMDLPVRWPEFTSLDECARVGDRAAQLFEDREGAGRVVELRLKRRADGAFVAAALASSPDRAVEGLLRL
jgi:hypothetical protein